MNALRIPVAQEPHLCTAVRRLAIIVKNGDPCTLDNLIGTSK